MTKLKNKKLSENKNVNNKALKIKNKEENSIKIPI